MTFYNQHSTALVGAAGQPQGYTIERSLRFRSSASAYLSRTPASAGNRKTWTYSVWFKRGKLGTSQDLLVAGSSVFGQHSTQIGFRSGLVADVLQLVDAVAGVSSAFELFTSQVFRDPSAWYHLVVAVDTTQATSSNRAKMYINGSQITAFSTATYSSQNHDTAVNNNVLHHIGRFTSANANPFDGYMTEINFIDGQALDPSYFGETDTVTGAWKPIEYTGTYGTNGFYLNFSDNTSTTTLGYDQSSNSNNWTTNNISLTAGSTYDSMQDVPTLTSESAGNYATLNPNHRSALMGTSASISDGNLASAATVGGWAVGTTAIPSSGKYYFEVYANAGNTTTGEMGILNPNARASGEVTYGWNSTKRIDGSSSSYGSGFTNGDTIGVAVDVTGGSVTFYKNNSSQGAISYTFQNNIYLPYAYSGDGRSYIFNFGQRPFTYTPPTGYKALNTYNLPDPTIEDGSEHFNTVLYTGNGSSQTITGAGFQPDLIWIKKRSGAENHNWRDAVRGISKYIRSDQATAEATNANMTFESDGFSVLDGNGEVNASSATYASWLWKANGSGVSNTDGSITSTVSANTSSGFSVIGYAGASANSTIGHGLGVAPEMFIVKRRDNYGASTYDWYTYHASLGNTNFIRLNTTGASTTYNLWQNTTPSSSVIYLANDPGVNGSGANFVCYAFAPVEGYSSFGSYVGNGNADGTFVYLGFRPAVVISKKSSGIGDWQIQTSDIPEYNVVTKTLFPNYSIAEATNPNLLVDFYSNGFKWRATSGNTNGNGDTFIYAAFAENPFKYSLAR